ncbi:metallophosphoesterase family protein [Ureibacillus aquaedulcis]|uniref:Metallophosphoesterase family protein n=1 Tax=Ureibacillus aquaedulcis TaxID=3058421 RepID=A0ABT8GST9_9BACL|nr:metallophosphoesterase family protein [Ureibacillus sp. BA0131]MDN4494468.1 metallophosphoesterase family protein [Ureibacillus sp. BA0131]
MKIAVISDIHGNLDALQAVLLDIKNRGIKEIYNLGDSLYGPLFPIETYRLLVKEKIQSIRGNCDRILLDSDTDNATVQYVQDLLGEDQKEWISNLPFSLETEDFYFCHGTPSSDVGYLLEEMSPNGSMLKKTEDIMELVKGISQNIIFCAHTHIPRVVYLPNHKIVINPGSVGLPAYEDELPIYHKMESGSPYGNYTIVTKQEDECFIEQILIPYNRDEAIRQSEKNGRSDWVKALQTGRV